ncbi:MAG: hypothetical protein NT004_09235 [Bacteroidetes bacterium]|nr:hypothetical protein [Bacteroidota bacterium]
MNRIICFLFLLSVAIGVYACSGSSSSSPNALSSLATGKKIEVFYFHFTRRCMTCNNLEKVSKDAVETQFAAQVKNGEITFKSGNKESCGWNV